MDTGKFGQVFRIYNHYTDMHGRVKVRTLCDLFNDVAEMHTVEQKADVATLNREGLTWMLRRIHLFMPDMPMQEENVCVETWNPLLEGLLVPRVYKVSSSEAPVLSAACHADVCKKGPEEGKIRAFAYTDWMLVNLKTMRPERPAGWMHSISGLYTETLPFGPSLMSRSEQKLGFTPDQGWEGPVLFKASYSDIDFNGHLTQSSYIQRMVDVHDFAFTDAYILKEIEVVYAREFKPDAVFSVSFRQDPVAEDKAQVSYAVLGAEDGKAHVWGRALWQRRD